MQEFTYYAPTKVLFGLDAELQTGREIKRFGGSRVLLVYGGGSAVKSGLLSRIEQTLDAEGIAHRALGGVRPNPLLSLAQQGVREAVAFGADFILGIGGGSAIDTAKAIAIGAAYGEADQLWAFWERTRPVEKALPTGAVTTIPAAGSETSDSSVLTNAEIHAKRGLSSDWNRPKFAVLNPALCRTLPAYQLACGAADVLMHTLERYFVPVTGNETTDELAEGLMRTVVRNGPAVLKDPGAYQPMSELMWCGSLSHNGLTGLGSVKDFSCHQMGHELSARFDLAHGASLTVVWGDWAHYCLDTDLTRFARYAEKVWGIRVADSRAAALAGIDATVDFFRTLGLPTCFSELEVGVQTDAVLRELAECCTYSGTRKVGTFHPLDFDALYEIYRRANH